MEAKFATLEMKIEMLDQNLARIVKLFGMQEKLQKAQQESTKEKFSLNEGHSESINPEQKDLPPGL